MPDDLHLITADALVPMSPELPQILPNAGIVLRNDRIAALGTLTDLRRQFGDLPAQHHPGTLLPGLINAHTHLELSYQSAANFQGLAFPQWVQKLLASYPPADQLESITRAAVRQGAAASLAAGVTTLGDISRHVQITRDELARSSRFSVPRVVSFGEVVGLGKMRSRAPALIQAASTRPAGENWDHPTLLAGISPHAPYTVEGPTLKACVRQAIIKSMPMTMHLAELSAENLFLHNLSGPLGRDWELMQKLDILDDAIPPMSGGPIRWAQRWALLLADAHQPRPRAFPVLLAHVNYCDRGELAQLAASRASVAYCPRTHAYFNHPPHRFADMLASEINVCLATDSLASNPDLSVLREAQFVRQKYGTDPHTLLEMITWRAAQALGLGDRLGSLAPGKLADFILLPIPPTENLLTQIVEQAPAPTALWLAGQSVPLPSAMP